jgi:two-component system sensor histidine kinase UhpB
MSLRLTLIALLIIALVAGLTLGGGVTLLNASHSVRNEMHASLIVAEQTIENVVKGLDTAADPQRDLDNLIASYRGNRHLHVSLIGMAATEDVRPVDDRQPFGAAPRWFMHLIGVKREARNVPVAITGKPSGIVLIQTDPRNEILEVWDELGGSLIVLAVFAGATIPLIYLVIGQALRPLERLAGAMEQVGQGDYAIRVDGPLSPELARLRDTFNRMARRLAEASADNRRLHEQLATLQEEERNDLARDLHDEIGPFLFAINVDVATMTRLLKEGQTRELSSQLRSVGDAARHLQRQVRGMLGRLRPIGLAELGLSEAVRSLIEFWRRRYPDIEYRADIATACENQGDALGRTVYRIIQEGLSNAVRHGRPKRIAISVERDPQSGYTIVDISDDGLGSGNLSALGYGLTGMEERVRAMGGRLEFLSRAGGGFAINAALPCGEALGEVAS